jgi:hypothetical protein
MFKKCNKCGEQWETRDEFLEDPGTEPIGYQVYFENLQFGLFLFNHSCGTTMGIEAEELMYLYQGPVHTKRKNDGRNCPGRCLTENIMSPCSDECRCAFISKILMVISDGKKEK